MTVIIETGAGVRNANSYVDAAWVTAYLTAENHPNLADWVAAAGDQDAAVVASGRYLQKRFGHRFRGTPEFNFEAVNAVGYINVAGQPADADALTVGSTTYTFRTALTVPDVRNEIVIGADADGTAANIVAALERDTALAGTAFSESTLANREVGAVAAGALITLTATDPGLSGNLIELTAAAPITTTAMADGEDEGPQRLALPRRGLRDTDGRLRLGIPYEAKAAQAEYAARATTSNVLIRDPSTDERTGGLIKRELVEAGRKGVVTETEYQDGSSLHERLVVPYPAADLMLAPLLKPIGVVR